jgi:hypothetical protein
MESRQLINSKDSHQASTLKHEPPDIYLEEHIMDLKFSPVANVLALG